MKKKILASILAAVILLCSAPMSGIAKIDFSSLFAQKASAETYGDYEYTVNGSNATITKYKGSASSVTTPSTLGGKTVTAIGDGAFSGKDVGSVTISSGVTSIATGAFSNCAYLTSVSIPSTVTYIGGYVWDGNRGAFANCQRLSNVTIAAGTKDATIDAYAFLNCKALKTITIPGNYISIGQNCFSGCSELTSFTLKKNSDSKKQSLGSWIFSDLTKLTNVSLPNTLESIPEGTFNSTGITSFNVQEGVISIGNYAFSNCAYLTSVSIPSTVTYIGGYVWDGNRGAFANCKKLTTVIMTAGTKDATIDAYAFLNCAELKTVHIPSNVNSIGEGAFSGCPNVTICNTTSSCYAKTYATENSIPFKVCTGAHGTVTPPATNYTATFKDSSGSKTVTGTKITTPAISARSGWTAMGWTTSTTATSTTVGAGAAYTLTGNTNFYALYKKDAKVTYDVNGGMNAPSAQTGTAYYNAGSGNTTKASFNIPSTIPTRVGYQFVGWSTSKTASSATYLAGGKIEITDNTTLYAVWKVGVLPTVGDVNGDSKINSTDALLVLQKTVGLKEFTYEQTTQADVNKDKKVNSSDALMILQYAVGLITSF